MNINTSHNSEDANHNSASLESNNDQENKNTIGWSQIRDQLPHWLLKSVQLSIPVWALVAGIFFTLMIIFD